MSRHSARTTTRSRWVLGALVVGLPLSLLPATAGAQTQAAPTAAPGTDRGWHGKPADLPKVPVMTGSGGAVASVDRDASQVGIDVLARGGNAADAAVATAAALGVTEPYSAGIGGGGFLVYYDARSKEVSTIDGRETAPATFTDNTFRKPDGTAMDFTTVVNSGLSVGVPGTPALWAKALRDYGTLSLNAALKPAERLAAKGFVVDQTFHDQTAQNAARFSKFPETARVFLRGGGAPAVGTVFTNPDMATAYRTLRTQGVDVLYRGRLGEAIVRESNAPHTAAGVSVMGGQMTLGDLAAYRALTKAPIHSQYKGLDVYGMPVPSSGGIAVAEILNLMKAYEDRTGTATSAVSDVDYLHRFSEASATAFADRNRYVGDVPGVPVSELVSPAFAAERACLFDPTRAQQRPIPFGSPDGSYTSCVPGVKAQQEPYEGLSTTHLTATDRWGNVASYTLTIEQTGGSGITVPGYGFLLNNELTDFNFVPLSAGVPDPNLPGPGKRPRSSMSPTILLDGGRPFLAVGSPGGATIITSVSQTILGYLDRGLPLVDAIAAPRLSSRNGTEGAEPALLASPVAAGLTSLGHRLTNAGEIGAVTAIRSLDGGLFEAAAETVRRGGGSAMVVQPQR
ncbi:gamma-glutamyltransferase [Humibacillus xanthopallidus]|uniref:Glutathione hydrolase proenzyme n=1 Tax=Humibacillus xanthopallidus TaxID=412689 RepID=A0A543HUN9_9MICO|nr:gamma-glutamyltransferase [Humibacillus xanthopallidus]TQM62061.1 gamma-glutamyltranspeptidase/glutathione hydrolase [Humibacillus xanthopallidus]